MWDEAESDLPQSDFMKAFTVAEFEMTEEAPALLTSKPSDSKEFWQNLLGSSVEQEKKAELERLGKGMRERRKVFLISFNQI